MVRKIRFTSRAEKDLVNILDYLKETWSKKSANHFLAILDKRIQLIKTFPHAGSYIIDKKSIRKCVVTKHVSLYYEVKDQDITVLTIFDSRQDVKKLKIE